MSKSSGSWLFGGRSGDRGAVTVVEVSVVRSAARRALITFWVFALGGIAGGVLAAVLDPEQAAVDVLLGLVVGAGSGLLAGVVVRVWPVLRAVWYWALELSAVVLLAIGWASLAHAASPLLALLVLATLAAALAGFGPSRRWVVMVAWCAIVRHRLRMCFTEFIRTPTRTNPGSGPLILWARPTPAGERVWVWLRPGLALSDLEGRTGQIAVACWAKEARVVHAPRRFAALIRVDVARRDPLVDQVDSPLSAFVPADFASGVTVPAGVVPVALDLADVPDSLDGAIGAAKPERRSRALSDRKTPEQRAFDNDAFI